MRTYLNHFFLVVFLNILAIQISTMSEITAARAIVQVQVKNGKTNKANTTKSMMKSVIRTHKMKPKRKKSWQRQRMELKLLQERILGPMPPKGRLDIWTEEARRIVWSVGPHARADV